MTNTTKQEVISRIGSTLEDLAKLVQSLNAFEGEATTVAPKSKTPKKVEEVAEVEAGEYDYDTLNDMSLSELKELADENGVEYTKSVKKQPIIKLILDALAGEEDEEEEEEVEEEEVEIDSEDEEEEIEEEDEDELDTVIETEDGEVDLADLTLKQLKKFAKDNDFEVTAKDKDGIIEEILASLDEEEVEEDGEEELDLESMSLEELKELAKENDIELPKKKKSQKAADYLEAIRELLAEELGAEEEDEEEEEEEDEDEEEDDEEEEEDIATQLGLNDMDVEELAEILEDYELSTKGKKQALIARIVKAVEDGIIELDEEGE